MFSFLIQRECSRSREARRIDVRGALDIVQRVSPVREEVRRMVLEFWGTEG